MARTALRQEFKITQPQRDTQTDTESTNPKLARPCATSVTCLKVFCVTQICNSQVVLKKKKKSFSSVELQRFLLLKLLLKDKTTGKQMPLSQQVIKIQQRCSNRKLSPRTAWQPDTAASYWSHPMSGVRGSLANQYFCYYKDTPMKGFI